MSESIASPTTHLIFLLELGIWASLRVDFWEKWRVGRVPEPLYLALIALTPQDPDLKDNRC